MDLMAAAVIKIRADEALTNAALQEGLVLASIIGRGWATKQPLG